MSVQLTLKSVITMRSVETRWEVSLVSATLDFLAMGRFAKVCCVIKLQYNGVSHFLTTLTYTCAVLKSRWID